MKNIIYTTAILAIVMASCSTPKMSVSEELRTNNDEYTVKGRNGTRIKQKLSFGEYATTNIKRSWTRGTSSRTGIGYGGTAQQAWENIISMEYIRKKQTIRFNLTDGKQYSEVYCVARFHADNLEIGKNPNSVLNIGIDISGLAGRPESMFYVQVYTSEKDERPWEMIIDNVASQAKPKKYIGYIAKSTTEYYSIAPVSKMELNGRTGNILAGSIGYEFRDPKGNPVAAVSLIDKGMVFLGKSSPEERFLLANACAALLLQDVIE